VATHLTSIARGLAPDDVASAVARQRLTSCLTDHAVAPMRDCVQVARAVGLPMVEIQRTTGVARQTLYRHAAVDDEKLRVPPWPQASIEVLMLAAAENGPAPIALLARRAGLSLQLAQSVALALERDERCAVVRDDDYSGLQVQATEETFALLREHFDDLYLQRPDAISIYLRVPEQHRSAIEQAAAKVLPNLEHVVMGREVAPSVMIGPELSLPVHAPTIRRALSIVEDIWDDLTDGTDIEGSPPQVANVIPPGGKPLAMEPSLVLDAFLEHILDAGGKDADALRKLRADYPGGVTERELAARCVTVAALSLRRAVGNEKEPRPIRSGDEAFIEWQPAMSVATTENVVPVKKAAVEALDLATERLGPLAGGRLGSFRRPGGPPNIVETFEPSTSDLIRIAEHAGAAAGAASAIGALPAREAMRRVIAG
jgi:hypothetical protein